MAILFASLPLFFLPFLLDLSLLPRYTLLALLLVVLSMGAHYRKLPLLNPDPVLVVYFCYVLFSALSCAWAINKAEAMFASGRELLGFGVFTGCLLLRKNGVNLQRSLSLAGITLGLLLGTLVLWHLLTINFKEKEALYAVTGLQGHKNLLSSFLFLTMGSILSSLPQRRPRNYVSMLVLLLLFVLVVMLRTKAVWLGLVVTATSCAFFYFFSSTRMRFNAWIMALMLLVLANIFWLVLFPGMLDALPEPYAQSANEMNEGERVVLFKKSYQVINDHPLYGVGAGNWQVYFPSTGLSGIWRAEDLNFTFQRPHNDFLWILSEYGIIGFNLFLFVVSGVIAFGLVSLTTKTGAEKFRLLILLSFLCGYLVISSFDFPKERIEHILFFNIFLALCYSSKTPTEPSRAEPVYGRPVYLLFTLLFFVVFIIGVNRMKGEYFTKKLQTQKLRGDNAGTLQYAKSTESVFYSLDPTSQPIAWYAGNAKASLGDMNGALAEFIRADKLHPFNRNVLNDLGSALYKAGNVEKAKLRYIEATIISPRYDEPKLNLVAVLITEKKWREAKYWLSTLMHDSERRTQYATIVEAMTRENSKSDSNRP